MQDVGVFAAIEDAHLGAELIGELVAIEGFVEDGGLDEAFDQLADIGVIIRQHMIQLDSLFLQDAAARLGGGNSRTLGSQFHVLYLLGVLMVHSMQVRPVS